MYQNDQQREEAKKSRADQMKKWKEYNEQVLKAVPEKVQTRNYFDLNILFLDALREGELASAQEIYTSAKKGVIDINTANKDGLTGLHEAATNNDLGTLEYLIGLNADKEVRDVEGWTPLHLAAQWEHMDATKYLVEHGANVLALTDDLELARDVTDNDAIKKYLSEYMEAKGFDLKTIESTKTKESRELEADVKKWLSEGRDINSFGAVDGATPLHISACKGYVNLLKFLLDNKATIDPYDSEGWTPLHAAVHWEQKECMKILIESGADVDMVTFRGEFCAELTESDEIKKLFEDLKSTRKVVRSVSGGLEAGNIPRTRSVNRRNSQQRKELSKLDQQKEKESAEAISQRVASVRSSEKSPTRKMLSDTFSPKDETIEAGDSQEHLHQPPPEKLTKATPVTMSQSSMGSANSMKNTQSDSELRTKKQSCCVVM